MTKRHLREYFAWFKSVIPERIALLEREIRGSPGWTEWTADFSADSLRGLEAWFVSHAVAHRREMPEPVILSGRQIATVDYQLTADALLRSFDSGIYFGQVLVTGNPAFKWDMLFNTSIRNVDYGHALVRGLERVNCNPVRLFVVTAHKMAKGNVETGGLLRLHRVWVDLLLGKPFVAEPSGNISQTTP